MTLKQLLIKQRILLIFLTIFVLILSLIPFNVQIYALLLISAVLGAFIPCGVCGFYMILGLLKFPVFRLFNGDLVNGFSCLKSQFGGFIWGTFLAVIICDLITGTPSQPEKRNSKIKLTIGIILGILLYNISGFIQFAILSGFTDAFVNSIFPHIVSDIAFIPLCFLCSISLRNKITYKFFPKLDDLDM